MPLPLCRLQRVSLFTRRGIALRRFSEVTSARSKTLKHLDWNPKGSQIVQGLIVIPIRPEVAPKVKRAPIVSPLGGLDSFLPLHISHKDDFRHLHRAISVDFQAPLVSLTTGPWTTEVNRNPDPLFRTQPLLTRLDKCHPSG
jgi:hypothetical protein